MARRVDEPHAKTECQDCPKCGARTKRTGQACKSLAMKNGRCRIHGGLSTGPKTPEGLENSRKAGWKHGYYSIEVRPLMLSTRKLLI